MGLLKRIFSVGTKRNKKKRALVDSDSSQFGARLEHVQEEDQEAAASRLLRSSSSRYAIVSEFDYTSCPALPHPINNVIQTPAASSISLSSTAATQRGTYTVTVHRRKQHALTEFPNANPPISDDITTPYDSSRYRSKSTSAIPRDSNCLQGLRQDPSVASLLNMYDEHGHLPPSAFSNTPPSPAKEGRVQTHRNGSTLRQLLGNPSSRAQRKVDNSATEGDISWAERCLGETDSMASMSSLGLLETPLDTHFSDARSEDHLHMTLPIQHACDLSNNTSSSSAVSGSNYPAFSSLEVEVSMVADTPPIPGSPYQNENPMTPQRASQVFGFLTEKRKSIFTDEKGVLGLPAQLHGKVCPPSHFSDCSSESISTQTSEKPPTLLHDTHSSLQSNFPAQLRRTQSQSHSPTSTFSSVTNYNAHHVRPQSCNSASQDILREVLRPHQVQVIITAPTPSDGTQTARTPRGPRQQNTDSYTEKPPRQRVHKSQEVHDAYPTLHDRSNPPGPNPLSSSIVPSRDPFTPIPPRQRRTHSRTMSHASSTLAFPESGHPRLVSEVVDAFNATDKGWVTNGKPTFNHGKENDLIGSAMFLPVTPVRSRSLFGFSSRISPASSTELSPVGQQLMMNLRQQRMSAREAERQKKGMRTVGAGFGKARQHRTNIEPY